MWRHPVLFEMLFLLSISLPLHGAVPEDGEQRTGVDKLVIGTTVSSRGGIIRHAGPGKTVKAGEGIRQGVWFSLSVPDGLSNSSVRAILQDSRGVLWFGTDGGVNRYDGEHFTNFTTEDGLVHNEVWSIIEDREGNLWFGTREGVSQYDPSPRLRSIS
jgi:hypothetical protein